MPFQRALISVLTFGEKQLPLATRTPEPQCHGDRGHQAADPSSICRWGGLDRTMTYSEHRDIH